MKVFIALSMLIGASFCIDTSQVKCLDNGSGIEVTLKEGDFADWGREEIKFGECMFGASGVKSGGEDCGVSAAADKEAGTITYSVEIKSGMEQGMITRRAPFSLAVACVYSTSAGAQVASSHIAPSLIAVIDEINSAGSFDLSLDLLNGEGVAIEGGALEVTVGEPVSVEASGAGNGFTARAINCWSTSDAAGDAGRYDLLKDGCQADETVSVDGSKVSFEAFAYSANTAGKVYLHCDLKACADDDESCGSCASRKRRAATMHKDMTMKTVSFKPIA